MVLIKKKKKKEVLDIPNDNIVLLLELGFKPKWEYVSYRTGEAVDANDETKRRDLRVVFINYHYKHVTFGGIRPRNDISLRAYTGTNDPDIDVYLGSKSFKMKDYCKEELQEYVHEIHIRDLVKEADKYEFDMDRLMDDIYEFYNTKFGLVEEEAMRR